MIGALRDVLRRWPPASRARLLRLNLIARGQAHQDFSSFIEPDAWRAALSGAADGKRVLIATNLGGHFALSAIDRMLAIALTLRGAAVTSVLCDAALPACQMCEFGLTPSLADLGRRGPDPLLCGYCHGPAESRLNQLALPVARLSAYLNEEDRAEARRLAHSAPEDVAALRWCGMHVGEHALAGALRFFARGDLEGQPHAHAILARFVESAVLTAAAYARMIDTLKPEVLVAHHGIYTPQGLAAEAARAKGVRVVTWNPAYRRHCFIFSHDDTYHHTLMNEPVGTWRDGPFCDADREKTRAYLESRSGGAGDWIRFHRDPETDFAALALDPEKPLVVALTNVFWDAQLHYPANAFASQRDWLLATIAWFAKRPDLQLAIRVHPAEASGSPPSRQRAQDVIAEAVPVLPGNVKLIAPESPLSTYALARRADAALIYGTKTGVELSAIGVPVIVAGEAWSRGKGFTIDAASPEDYRAQLEKLPLRARLSPEQQDLALRYAHHFFFRRMIELPFVEPAAGARRFTIAAHSLAALDQGACTGLDVICDGILRGAPFAMPV